MAQEKAVATVTRHEIAGSTWEPGDLIAGYIRGKYTVMLCVTAKRTIPSGAEPFPADMAIIEATAWRAVCDAVQALGFTRPKLGASAVFRTRSKVQPS